MEKKDYLEFVKEFNDADFTTKKEMVHSIIIQNINLESEMAFVSLAIDDLNDLEELFNDTTSIVEYYMEKSIVFFEALRGYTNLDMKDEYDGVENYNPQLEDILKENQNINRYYVAVNSIRQKQKIKIIKDLTKSLDNIPSVDEVEKMTQSFSEIFKEENKSNIKTLQDIASYNDPSMKSIKDAIYNTVSDLAIEK